MSQENPTQQEIIAAANGLLEETGEAREEWDELPDVNIDCLGCLLDAHAKGIVTDAEFEEISRMIEEISKAGRATCPKCGSKEAYVSTFEPSIAHCGVCGAYLFRAPNDEGEMTWRFYRQGKAFTR